MCEHMGVRCACAHVCIDVVCVCEPVCVGAHVCVHVCLCMCVNACVRGVHVHVFVCNSARSGAWRLEVLSQELSTLLYGTKVLL